MLSPALDSLGPHVVTSSYLDNAIATGTPFEPVDIHFPDSNTVYMTTGEEYIKIIGLATLGAASQAILWVLTGLGLLWLAIKLLGLAYDVIKGNPPWKSRSA